MDTEFYREFITIVETKNFAEAADILSMSTSAISRHLKAAEEELGVELFSRTSRTVQLNEYGEMFLPYAQSMVQQQTEFMHRLGKYIEQKKNTISYTGNYQFNSLLIKFRKKYPQYSVVKVPRKGFALKTVLNGRCDLAVYHNSAGSPPEDDSQLEKLVLGKDSLVVAMNRNDPLAARGSIDLRELRDYPIIALLSNETNEPMLEEYFAAGVVPKVAFSVSTGEEALALVAEGHGAVIIMRRLAERAAKDSVRLLDIEGLEPCSIFLGRLKGRKPSPAAEALWEFAKQSVAE